MTIDSYKDKKKRRDRKNKTILKKWGQPSDIVGASIFLASEASNYILEQKLQLMVVGLQRVYENN